jgi:hypothetical protein
MSNPDWRDDEYVRENEMSAAEADDNDFDREYLQYRQEQDADGGAAWRSGDE